MKHATEQYNGDSEGTSLQGYVTTTYDALVATFGEPNRGAGDKTNVEWVLLIGVTPVPSSSDLTPAATDGVIVTIYDWKQEVLPRGEYDWNIGGFWTTPVEVDELVRSAMAPEPFTRFYPSKERE